MLLRRPRWAAEPLLGPEKGGTCPLTGAERGREGFGVQGAAWSPVLGAVPLVELALGAQSSAPPARGQAHAPLALLGWRGLVLGTPLASPAAGLILHRCRKTNIWRRGHRKEIFLNSEGEL